MSTLNTPRQIWPAWAGKPVLVLGLGASGLAMARMAAMAGAQVTVADTRAAPPQAEVLRAEHPEVTVLCCAFEDALWQRERWALVCRSPGLSPQQLAPVAQPAAQAGVPVVGELTLFAQCLRHAQAACAYAPKVLAITGTNGKTTTTQLTAHLLREAGWHAVVAGNIGPTLLDVWREATPDEDTAAWPQAWVLELSSFQLDGVTEFEPTAGTVLNITQDHLDWHGSMAAYAEAKRAVFGQHGAMVLNREDATVAAWQPAAVDAPKPRGGKRAAVAPRVAVSFGTDAPTRPGDWGLADTHGMAWLARADASETADTGLAIQRLIPAEALRIQGRHNATNALAALALASLAGAPLAPMLHGLRDYRGEPHRVESVAIVDEVEYIDDSKGTNVGATLAALNGLGPSRRLVVILGGDGKGQDFSPLAAAVAMYARAVALIGRDADRIAEALKDCGVPMQRHVGLPEAVHWCAAQAKPSDAVLLSPACASLDMFKDYAHRAQVFVDAVTELQRERGMA